MDGAATALDGPFPVATLDEARELILRHARTVVMLAQVQVNPLGGAGPLYHARQVILAALPRVDLFWFVPVGAALLVGGLLFGRQIANIADEGLRAATHIIGGVLGDVATVLRDAISAVGGFISNVGRQVAVWIWTLLNPVLQGISNAIHAGFQFVTSLVKRAIDNASDALGAVLGTVGRILANALSAAGGAVHGVVVWLGGRILDGLGAIGRTVSGIIAWLGGLLGPALGAVGKAIHTAVTWLGGVLAGVGKTIVDGLFALFRLIIEAGGAVVDAVIGFVKTTVVDPLARISGEAARMAIGALSGVSTGDPEAAPAIAAGLMTLAIPFGVAAHVLANAAEHTHPLKQVGYGFTARALVDLTNVGAISDAAVGSAYNAAVGVPLTYWVQRRIRSRLPGVGDIAKLWMERSISTADARLYMGYLGFSETRISAFLDQFDEEVNLMQLRRLLDSGTLPPVWTTRMLQRLGYNNDDITVIEGALDATQFAQQRAGLYNAAFGLLKDGLSTPERFVAEIAPLRLHPRQVSLALRAASLQYAAGVTSTQVANLRTSAGRGLISVDELGVGLAALGVAPDRVRVEQARARTAVAPRVAAKAAAAAERALHEIQAAHTRLWVERFRRGIIAGDALYANLVAVGLDPNVAQVTVGIETAKRLPVVTVRPDTSLEDEQERIGRELQRLFVDQFRAGLVGADTLTANLIALGLSDELVAVIVAQEQVRAYEPPDTTPPPEEERIERLLQSELAGLYRDRFRAGYIDGATYLAALIGMGVDPDLATVTVEREQLRADVAAAARAPAD